MLTFKPLLITYLKADKNILIFTQVYEFKQFLLKYIKLKPKILTQNGICPVLNRLTIKRLWFRISSHPHIQDENGVKAMPGSILDNAEK